MSIASRFATESKNALLTAAVIEANSGRWSSEGQCYVFSDQSRGFFNKDNCVFKRVGGLPTFSHYAFEVLPDATN
jgi:hypothetical protein